MVLNLKFNVLLNFISVYFVFYISFDLFLSETKIYSTKICEFFVGSSRPPYTSYILVWLVSEQAPYSEAEIESVVRARVCTGFF